MGEVAVEAHLHEAKGEGAGLQCASRAQEDGMYGRGFCELRDVTIVRAGGRG